MTQPSSGSVKLSRYLLFDHKGDQTKVKTLLTFFLFLSTCVSSISDQYPITHHVFPTSPISPLRTYEYAMEAIGFNLETILFLRFLYPKLLRFLTRSNRRTCCFLWRSMVFIMHARGVIMTKRVRYPRFHLREIYLSL